MAEVAIHDADAFARDYAPRVAGTLQPYGGRLLTSGKVTALEGNVPQRFVIHEYQPLLEIRKKTATTTLFIAEGLTK